MTTLNLDTLPSYITNVLKAVQEGVNQAVNEGVGCQLPSVVEFEIRDWEDQDRIFKFTVPLMTEQRYNAFYVDNFTRCKPYKNGPPWATNENEIKEMEG